MAHPAKWRQPNRLMADHAELQPRTREPSRGLDPPPPWWRGRALRAGLTSGVVVFGVGLVTLRWDTYGEIIADADPGWLALGVALLLVGNLLSTWLHGEILSARGTKLAPLDLSRLVLVPNIMKYIPGFVAQAATFYQLGRRAGVDRRGVVLLFIEAMWVTLAVTAALGAAALLAVESSVPAWMPACILAGSLIVLIPAVRDRVLRLARVVPKDAPDALGRLNLRPLLIAALGVAALGLHGMALALGLGATDLTFAESVAAFAGGWVVGLLAFVFPGGLGPRELVASVLLAEFTSPGTAVVLVIISRFATVVADVIAGTTALLLPSSSRSARAKAAGIYASTAGEATGG